MERIEKWDKTSLKEVRFTEMMFYCREIKSNSYLSK